MIVEEIRKQILPGAVIPKPQARGDFTVKGWGTRRGETALIYRIPNHRNPDRPSEKGITASEFEAAARKLERAGKLTNDWFHTTLPACAREASCNFTTLGGILLLLGKVEYAERGVYRHPRPNSSHD